MEEIKTKKRTVKEESEDKVILNCLRDEKVIVRFVPKNTGIWGDNPKHVLAGGMAESAAKSYTVPMMQGSKTLVKVLTDEEQECLESIMGLEYNALSPYKRENNYWSNFLVRLEKGDNYLDLSLPVDYIKYKVLLANKDFIAPSLDELTNRRKATYQFVIILEGEEDKKLREEVNINNACYLKLGKIADKFNVLRTVIETVEGRTIADKTKIEFLQNRAYKLIQSSPKIFYAVLSDELLEIKALIRTGVEKGVISNRSGFYYLKETGAQLCNKNESPDIKTAAKYLSLPVNQELKLTIEKLIG